MKSLLILKIKQLKPIGKLLLPTKTLLPSNYKSEIS